MLPPDPKDQVMGTSEEEDWLAMPTKNPDAAVRWQRMVAKAVSLSSDIFPPLMTLASPLSLHADLVPLLQLLALVIHLSNCSP